GEDKVCGGGDGQDDDEACGGGGQGEDKVCGGGDGQGDDEACGYGGDGDSTRTPEDWNGDLGEVVPSLMLIDLDPLLHFLYDNCSHLLNVLVKPEEVENVSGGHKVQATVQCHPCDLVPGCPEAEHCIPDVVILDVLQCSGPQGVFLPIWHWLHQQNTNQEEAPVVVFAGQNDALVHGLYE
ncbi:hypothetical protein Hamer_G004181, partial [Homarus americanus]